jgi:hypothetical protein
MALIIRKPFLVALKPVFSQSLEHSNYLSSLNKLSPSKTSKAERSPPKTPFPWKIGANRRHL